MVRKGQVVAVAKYDKPALRERIKNKIMRGSKGGKPGQWSARKSQLLVKEYESAGGGYIGRKNKTQKSLSRWTEQDWTTASGKPSLKTGEVYLPKRSVAQLRGTSKLRTANRKKKAALRKGEQVAKTNIHKGRKR